MVSSYFPPFSDTLTRSLLDGNCDRDTTRYRPAVGSPVYVDDTPQSCVSCGESSNGHLNQEFLYTQKPVIAAGIGPL